MVIVPVLATNVCIDPYVYAPGQATPAPMDPKLTSHYGVSVVPVNNTMPYMQFNPYSMHPMPPGMPASAIKSITITGASLARPSSCPESPPVLL